MTKEPARAKRVSARLAPELVATKGRATKPVEAPQRGAGMVAAADSRERVKLTLRLLPEHYERLRVFGFQNRRSHQDIIEAALLRYLDAEENARG